MNLGNANGYTGKACCGSLGYDGGCRQREAGRDADGATAAVSA